MSQQKRLSQACEDAAAQIGLALKLSGEYREPEAADLIYQYMRDFLYAEEERDPAQSGSEGGE